MTGRLTYNLAAAFVDVESTGASYVAIFIRSFFVSQLQSNDRRSSNEIVSIAKLFARMKSFLSTTFRRQTLDQPRANNQNKYYFQFEDVGRSADDVANKLPFHRRCVRSHY
jgi:hypothetical protein